LSPVPDHPFQSLGLGDEWTFEAMRALHRHGIAAGASGSAAIGGLLALCQEPSMSSVRQELGLDDSARVLAIVSEGVTDPALWSSMVAAQ